VIALAASILLALYIIIPGLLSRFVYRLFIPLRVLAVGRTEEASRALATAMLPFLLALFVVWYVPGLDRFPLKADPQFKEQDYKLIASCLYSEATFAKEEPMFWSALQRSISRQILFLFWYYSLTILTALSLGYLTASYGRFGSNRAYRWLANKFLLPRISEWHPLLTPFVFADKQLRFVPIF